MSALVLELKQGEMLLINGAVIRFRTRTRLELSTQARFLFGKQVMAEQDAVTPAQKLYYAIQQAYAEGGAAPLAQARALAEALGQNPLAPMLEGGASLEALKLARQILREGG